MTRITFIENNHVSQQDYFDVILIKDCIDELVALNGSCNDNFTIQIIWNP